MRSVATLALVLALAGCSERPDAAEVTATDIVAGPTAEQQATIDAAAASIAAAPELEDAIKFLPKDDADDPLVAGGIRDAYFIRYKRALNEAKTITEVDALRQYAASADGVIYLNRRRNELPAQ